MNFKQNEPTYQIYNDDGVEQIPEYELKRRQADGEKFHSAKLLPWCSFSEEDERKCKRNLEQFLSHTDENRFYDCVLREITGGLENQEEFWSPAVNLIGEISEKLEVSTFGNVRDIHGSDVYYDDCGRFYINNKKIDVARCVLCTFLGVHNSKAVHMDADKRNNRLTNLAWTGYFIRDHYSNGEEAEYKGHRFTGKYITYTSQILTSLVVCELHGIEPQKVCDLLSYHGEI